MSDNAEYILMVLVLIFTAFVVRHVMGGEK